MRRLALLVCAALLNGCITYRDFPTAMIDSPPAQRGGKLHYRVSKFPVLSFGGGETEIQVILQEKSGFAESVKSDAAPQQGLFVRVDTEWKALSPATAVFAYISAIFLLALPFWSNREGFKVHYHVFVDGTAVQTYSYEIRRKAGFWIVLLPLAVVNVWTYSEKDAFGAVTYQFLKEAEPLFAPHR